MLFSSLVLAATVSSAPPSITTHHVMRVDGARAVCSGADASEAEEFQYRIQERSRQQGGLSYYLDTYRERDISVDFDRDFPDAAKDAVRAAANIWDSYLLVDVPVVIEAIYEEFDEDDDTLAYASVSARCDRYCYPNSLWNQRVGRDANLREPEFSIVISDRDDWYLGLDGNPPDDKIDLIDIAIHEIGHGLGITGGFDLSEDYDEEEPTLEYDGEHRYRFNWFLWTREHGWLFDTEDVPNPSTELYKAATGHKLFWGYEGEGWVNTRGEPLKAVKVNGGPVMLWAPTEFGEGSSISHLDKDAYPNGSHNTLMTSSAEFGSAVHDPGPVVLGMLYDMGWELKERGLDPLDILRCLEGR